MTMRLLAFSILVIVLASSANAQEIKATRADVCSALKSHIVLTKELQNTHGDRLLSDAKNEIDRLAPEILPEFIAATSKDALDLATSAPIIVTYADPAYVRLLLKVHLAGVPVRLAWLARFPPLSESDNRALRQNVEDLSHAAGDILKKYLGGDAPALSNAEIDGEIQHMRSSLLRRLETNQFSYAMTRPLSSDEVQSILSDFDKRLAENKDEIRNQLIRNNDSHAQSRIVLAQITSSLSKVIMNRTSSPQRREISLKQLSPELAQLGGQLSEIERRLGEVAVHNRDTQGQPVSEPDPATQPQNSQRK